MKQTRHGTACYYYTAAVSSKAAPAGRSLALSCHGGKINSAILPVPVSLAVIEIGKSNEQRADNCFINILLPALRGSVAHDHRALDMTRTKCEIEQLGSRLSDLTSRSDRLALYGRTAQAAPVCSDSRLNIWTW